MKKCNINSKLEDKKSLELKETLDPNNNKMQRITFCAKLPTPKNEVQKDKEFKPKERGS
jgi:hypothetical protein